MPPLCEWTMVIRSSLSLISPYPAPGASRVCARISAAARVIVRKLRQVAQTVAELKQRLVPPFRPLALGDLQEQHREPLVAGFPRPRLVPPVGQRRDEHLELCRLAGFDDALIVLDQFDRNVGNHFQHRAAHRFAGWNAGERIEGGVHLDEAEITHAAIGIAQGLADKEPLLHPLEQPAPARFAVAQPPFAHHLARGFRAGAEHPADAACFVPDGAVGEGEPGLLGITVPQHQQRQVFMECRFSGKGAVHQRADVRPDIRPYLGERLAERMRMLGPEDRQIAVVIKKRQFRTPGYEHRELGIEQEADDGTQGLRPCFRTPQRRGRPVMGAHQRAHDAAAGQELRVRAITGCRRAIDRPRSCRGAPSPSRTPSAICSHGL